MSLFRITPRARDDLKNIGRYTEQHWGKVQRNNYLKSLEKRFAWLAENPRLGKHRSDIQDGYHSFPVTSRADYGELTRPIRNETQGDIPSWMRKNATPSQPGTKAD